MKMKPLRMGNDKMVRTLTSKALKNPAAILKSQALRVATVPQKPMVRLRPTQFHQQETQEDASVKGDKANDPKSPCPPSWPDDNNKDSEEEWKCQHHKDTWLLDKNFCAWHARMIGEGCAGWEKHDAMTCNHGDPCKELRHLDPTSPPLDYMKHCRVFKAKKSNEYDLCHF